jgi:hypothetical protein
MAALTKLSPHAHRRFDSVALPGMLVLTAWTARRRSRPAAALMSLTTAVEAMTFVLTDFPPGILPAITFRDHTRIGLLGTAFIGALSFLIEDLPADDRRLILGTLTVPAVVNAGSAT